MYFYHCTTCVVLSTWLKKKSRKCWTMFLMAAILCVLHCYFNIDIVWQLSIYGLCLLESTGYEITEQEKTFKGRLGCFEMQVEKEEFELLLLCISLKWGVRGCKFPESVTPHEPISDHLPSLNMIQSECTNAERVADRCKVCLRWRDLNCLLVQKLMT